jgi:4-hydroxybenzoate polyprenyltransferase
MKKILAGLLSLTRFKEYIAFVTVTTLLGATAGEGRFGWRLWVVLVANWLVVGFAFMINDVEDAEDDALNPAKLNRNPISCKRLSPKHGYMASSVVALISAAAYAFLGWQVFTIGLACLITGFFYSWHGFRIKTMPFLDMLSHCMMLAGFQFLCGYFSFSSHFNQLWLFPFLFVVCISLYGELFNELRDYEGDLKAGLKHTAAFLGERVTHILMMVFLAVGIGAGIYTVFVEWLITPWVLIALGSMAVIFALPRLLKIKRSFNSIQLQQPLQKPLELAAALALTVSFIQPWLLNFIKVQ